MNDPNLAIHPDFSTDEFIDARHHLTNEVVNDNQAVIILGTLWDINNMKEKQKWEAHREREAQQELEAAEEAEEECCHLHDEEEVARVEDQKKNKAKFAPVCDHDIPSGPVNIPTPYTSCKLKKGEYCELYFFTNDGLAEVESLNPSIDDEAMTLLKANNGQHVWVPASSTNQDKTSVIRDEDLSWEQFGEAAIRLINAMREHEWPEDRIQMHVTFWSALEEHPW
ncbi:hypothetical protein EDC04DRAFT_2576650 [Pisolithus marmoratus]|nr:hypothetical protein EDC04DRAFT_2576650 [Pisolithus marmoratus]